MPKNRDKYILKVNEYDLMMKILNSYRNCPIRAVTGEMHYDRCPKYNTNCSECVQKWLNEEAN